MSTIIPNIILGTAQGEGLGNMFWGTFGQLGPFIQMYPFQMTKQSPKHGICKILMHFQQTQNLFRESMPRTPLADECLHICVHAPPPPPTSGRTLWSLLVVKHNNLTHLPQKSRYEAPNFRVLPEISLVVYSRVSLQIVLRESSVVISSFTIMQLNTVALI